MSNPIFAPSMSLTQIAAVIDEQRRAVDRDIDVYVRIESFCGKPVCFLVRERKDDSIPGFLRQAE